MTRKRLDRETRKKQIVEAAMNVFAREGFEGASIGDIVAEAGLSKGGLYWHFDTKDDIIAAVMQAFFDHEMADLTRVAAEEAPVRARLEKLGRLVAQELEQTFGALPIALEFYAVAARQESVRQSIAAYFAIYREQLALLVAEGIEQGQFRPVDSAGTATAIIALFEGLALLWAVNPRAFKLSQQVQQSLAIFLDGLQGQPQPEPGERTGGSSND